MRVPAFPSNGDADAERVAAVFASRNFYYGASAAHRKAAISATTIQTATTVETTITMGKTTTTETTTTTTGCQMACEPLPPIMPDVCPDFYFECYPATPDKLTRANRACGVFSCTESFDIGVVAPDGTIYNGPSVGCEFDGHRYLEIGSSGQHIIVDDFKAFCGSI